MELKKSPIDESSVVSALQWRLHARLLDCSDDTQIYRNLFLELGE